MKLNQPIQSVESFKKTRYADWVRKYIRTSRRTTQFWPRGMSPVLALLVFGPVGVALFAVEGFWSYLFFGLGLVNLFICTLLMMATSEKLTKEVHLSPAQLAEYKRKTAQMAQEK